MGQENAHKTYRGSNKERTNFKIINFIHDLT